MPPPALLGAVQAIQQSQSLKQQIKTNMLQQLINQPQHQREQNQIGLCKAPSVNNQLKVQP
jgi:hypothetical protein